MTHLASRFDAHTRCGLELDFDTPVTILAARVTCPDCRKPARTHADVIADGAARRGNTFTRSNA